MNWLCESETNQSVQGIDRVVIVNVVVGVVSLDGVAINALTV
jgi:hypothetical protein